MDEVLWDFTAHNQEQDTTRLWAVKSQIVRHGESVASAYWAVKSHTIRHREVCRTGVMGRHGPFMQKGGWDAVLRVHVTLYHPRVIEYVRSLPRRKMSWTLERLLLQALENDEVLAAKVAEEVVRRLEARGWTDGKRDGDGRQEASDAATVRSEGVPHNAVTAFLRTWGDGD